MNGRFAIIGAGSFGSSLARHLSSAGAEVTLMDLDRERIEALKDAVEVALIMDCTDGAAMKAQELDEMDAVIIALGDDFGETVLILALLQELGVKHIHVRVSSERERAIVTKLGAEGAVFPAERAGRSFARSLLLGLGGRLDTVPVGNGHCLVQLAVPKDFVGSTIESVQLRELHNLHLVTVLTTAEGKEDPQCCGIPKSTRTFNQGERMILFGQENAISAFVRKFGA